MKTTIKASSGCHALRTGSRKSARVKRRLDKLKNKQVRAARKRTALQAKVLGEDYREMRRCRDRHA